MVYGQNPSRTKQSISLKTESVYLLWLEYHEFRANSFAKFNCSRLYRVSCIDVCTVDCLQTVLREDVKEQFKYEVDRSSPSNKLRELIGWSKDITLDINYTRRVMMNPLARFFVRYWSVSLEI